MKIALTGSTGQVGLETIAAARGDVAILPLARADADLMTPGAAAEAIRRLRPDAVINAGAWTAVDKAESERDAAFRVNADAVGEMAAAARSVGARFIHLSTDYVYSGDGVSPLDETAPVDPQNVYGASKLKGEMLARAADPDCVVIRTSWVFSAHGSNFVKTMLRLSETRAEVSVVDDQRGGPTPASSIARACLAVAARRDGPAGLYHFQGAPAASWADFAAVVFAAAGRATAVRRIETAAFPTPTKRPLFTVLNCSKILADYGLEQPDWRAEAESVARLLAGRG